MAVRPAAHMEAPEARETHMVVRLVVLMEVPTALMEVLAALMAVRQEARTEVLVDSMEGCLPWQCLP